VRLYRRRLVTADGGFFHSTSVLFLKLFFEFCSQLSSLLCG
jgi:hypothetical protein